MTRPPAVEAAARAAAAIDPALVPGLRRRLLIVLVITSALGSTGYLAAVTVGTLAAAQMAGGAALGGVPTAALTVGTATAAGVLSGLMLRFGRRPGLIIGLAIGFVGALVSFAAILAGSIPLLLGGSALTGFANGAGQLGRYVGADLAPLARRASALGLVVWGATIGAVVGPNLTAPGGVLAESIGLPILAGPYLLTAAFIGAAIVVAWMALRPEPYALADPSALEMRAEGTDAPSALTLFRVPSVLVALVALVAGQVVMVLIMTMTPIHLTQHGHGLSTVGLVLSAHTFGMFALSPISGRLTDRFGSPAVIACGLATMTAAALLSALAPPDGGLLLTLGLFLLGYGWNLGFVAGSSMLTRGLALAERTRVQGIADGLTWGSAAVASASSGVIVAGASYTALGLLGIGLLVVPGLLLLLRRGTLAPS
ncbi:MAG: MFS transporter, partial [Candidatus Limnocylindria bacterium]